MNIFGLSIEWDRHEQKEEMTALCKQKLLRYSESFRELARSFDDKIEPSNGLGIDFGEEVGVTRSNIWEERKMQENRKAICDNLYEVAQVMSKVAREELEYELWDGRDCRTMQHALREEGIYADCIWDMPMENGRMAVGMTLYTRKRYGISSDEVAELLSELLKCKMEVSATSPIWVEEKKKQFCFLEEAKYIALTGYARAVREDETVSGDNYSFLETEKGKKTIFLSDGTGSGEKACRDSEKVLELMEKMLEAGYDNEEALRLINMALYTKEEDGNHPTMDICDLDLYLGQCIFRKVGAAVSYVKRQGEVEEVDSETLPLGILDDLNMNKVVKTVRDGDYIIMMTDGVVDAFRGEEYDSTLREVIRDLEETNPGEFAEKLLHLALHSCGGRIYDDMTILVVGIWEKSSIT